MQRRHSEGGVLAIATEYAEHNVKVGIAFQSRIYDRRNRRCSIGEKSDFFAEALLTVK